MRKAYTLVPAIVLAIGAVAWLVISYGMKGHEIRAISRIKIEVVKDWAYTNDFYGPQFSGIKRFLKSRESGLILAKTSGADTSSFSFDNVGIVHGTKLIYLEYSGDDSNVVQTVASSAASLVVSFYKTNFPSLEASYVDVFIRK